METIKQFIGNSVFWFVVGILLTLFLVTKCGRKGTREREVIKTEISYKYDTIVITVRDTVTIVNSEVRIDTTKVYDTIYKNKYFEQLFSSDSGRVNIKTYGGFTDSVNVDIKSKEKTIYETKTVKETQLLQYKSSIGVDYMYNGSNNILLGYGRNFGRFGLVGKMGINIDDKKPIIGLTGKINF